MSNNSVAPNSNEGGLETSLREALHKVSSSLKSNSLGVLCRKPLIDQDYPEVSDVDITAIWDQPEEYPERLVVTGPLCRIFVDVLWIPLSVMVDPVKAACYRTLPHLLLESETVWWRSDTMKRLVNLIKFHAYDKAVWEHRLRSHIQFGDAAFEEAVRNINFPQATLFFLQAAHSLYLIALADCMKRSVINLRTRPMAKLIQMTSETGSWLEEMFVRDLHLRTNPSPLLKALRRVYDVVAAKCQGQPVRGMSLRTGGHYSYTLSPLELEYRENVALAMMRGGDYVSATFYIRFWAYCLSRCPIVLEEAIHGENPSFYVPSQPLKRSLETICPEIIDDLRLILGGEVTRVGAEASVRETSNFKKLVVEQIRKRGLDPLFAR